MNRASLFCLVILAAFGAALAQSQTAVEPRYGAPLSTYWTKAMSLYGTVEFCFGMEGVGQFPQCAVFPAAFANDPAIGCFSIDSGITIQFTCQNGTYTKLPLQDAVGNFIGFQWFYDPIPAMQYQTEAVAHTVLTYRRTMLSTAFSSVAQTTKPNGKPAEPAAAQLVALSDNAPNRTHHFAFSLTAPPAKAGSNTGNGNALGQARAVQLYAGDANDAGAVGQRIGMYMLVDPTNNYPLEWFSSYPQIQPIAIINGCPVCIRLPIRGITTYNYDTYTPVIDRAVLQLPVEAYAPASALPSYADLGCHY